MGSRCGVPGVRGGAAGGGQGLWEHFLQICPAEDEDGTANKCRPRVPSSACPLATEPGAGLDPPAAGARARPLPAPAGDLCIVGIFFCTRDFLACLVFQTVKFGSSTWWFFFFSLLVLNCRRPPRRAGVLPLACPVLLAAPRLGMSEGQVPFPVGSRGGAASQLPLWPSGFCRSRQQRLSPGPARRISRGPGQQRPGCWSGQVTEARTSGKRGCAFVAAAAGVCGCCQGGHSAPWWALSPLVHPGTAGVEVRG